MDDSLVFSELLKDIPHIAKALASFELTMKEKNDLFQLYSSEHGVLATRDKGNRVRGETVYSCSKIGSLLTRYFDNIGPIYSMSWIGYIETDRHGNERWLMQPNIRSAIAALGWFRQHEGSPKASDRVVM